jgi:hypothetical protein
VAKREEDCVIALGAQLAPASVATLPLLEGDVHDLDGVQAVADHLFGLNDPSPTASQTPEYDPRTAGS